MRGFSLKKAGSYWDAFVRSHPTATHYIASPVFVAGSALFSANTVLLKLGVGHYIRFLKDHFDDLVLPLVALPIIFSSMELVGVRRARPPASVFECFAWIAVISMLLEGIFPRYLHFGTADWADVICYFVGCAMFLALTRWRERYVQTNSEIPATAHRGPEAVHHHAEPSEANLR